MARSKTSNSNLEDLHQKLQLLMINTEEAFVLIDTTFSIVSFNEKFKKLYNTYFGVNVIKGDSILNYSRTANTEKLKKIYIEVFNGNAKESELTIKTQHNETLTFRNKYKPALDEEGKIIGAFVSAIDITEKKKLQEAENRFKVLIENVNEVISLVDKYGNTNYISPAIQKITGFTPDEIVNKDCFINIRPNQILQSKKTLQKILKNTGTPIHLLHQFLHKNGNYIWMEGTATNLLNDPIVKAIVFNYRDVTERIEAEEKLKQSESNLKAIFNSSAEAFILLDEKGVIKTFNPKAAKNKIIVEGELKTGNKLIDYIKPERKKDVLKHINKSLKGELIAYDTFYQVNNEQKKWYHIILSPVKENDKVIGVSITVTNITKRKHFEEELKTSEVRFRSLIEHSGDMLALINSEGMLTYVSPSCERIFGYTNEESQKLHAMHGVHPDDIELAKNKLNFIFSNPGIPLVSAIRNKKKDGEYIWIEGTITNMLNVSGVNSIVVNFRDVNEKILNQQQKEFERRDKEALINSTADLIWSVNKDLKLIAANNAFINAIYNVTGKTIKSGDSLTLHEFYEEKTILTWQNYYEQALSGKSFKTEMYVAPSGPRKEAWLEIHFNPIYNKHEIVELACYCRNITENKFLQEQLKQSEAQFRGAFNYSAIGMGLANLNGKWLEVNDSFCAMLGYTKQEILKLSIHSITHPNDVEETIENLKKLVNKKTKSYQTEKRYLHKNGSIIWVLLVASVVKDQSNNANKFVIQIKDITQKKLITEELRKSHELLQKLTDKVPVAVFKFTIEKNGEITFPFVSKAIENILPNINIELLKKNAIHAFENAIPKESNRILKAIKHSEKNQTNWEIEFQSTHNNQLKWHKAFSRFEKKEDDKTIWYGYLEDITERKLNEEKIRLAKERYDIVAKATNDAIYDWDLVTGEIIRPGDGLHVLFGYNKNNQENKKDFWENRIHPEDIVQVKKNLKFSLELPTNHICNQEYRFKKADGEYAFVYDKSYIIRNDSGKAQRIIGAMQDITQRIRGEELLKKLNENLEKRAEDLQQSNSELEQFAYIASHDLQEPLRMITSFLNLLELKYKDQLDKKARQYIYFATDGAIRMRNIILDLLEYSTAAKKTHETELIDVDHLIQEALQLNLRVIEEKNAVIEWDNLPKIVGNKASLQQVFQNLISNALKYQSKDQKPTIKIDAIQTETHWQFSFTDNGIGIDKRFFDKIFIVFQRLHGKEEYAGTGLGLAICKKIIEKHNGKIWVESQLGEGSTFYFTIVK